MSRTVVFFDGQNLYHAAKDAWAPTPPTGPSPYSWPSYDVEKLAQTLVARVPQRALTQITGVPDPGKGSKEKLWHGFWTNKLRFLSSRGIYVYKGRVNPGGQEKGVDVSLAIDLVRLTYEQAYEAAIIVSQDWDFASHTPVAFPALNGSVSTRALTIHAMTLRTTGHPCFKSELGHYTSVERAPRAP